MYNSQQKLLLFIRYIFVLVFIPFAIFSFLQCMNVSRKPHQIQFKMWFEAGLLENQNHNIMIVLEK